VFGPGAWRVTVQAHIFSVETEMRTVIDTGLNPPVPSQILFMREGGQLVLLTVSGS